MVFTDVESFETLITNEQMAAKIPGRLFYKNLLPNKIKYTSARYICKYCNAFVNLRKMEENKLVVTRLFPIHNHSTVKFEDPVEEEIYKVYKAVIADSSANLTTIRKHITREFKLSTINCLRLVRRF